MGIFAGRRLELAELDSAYDGARAGHGRLILISGAPGIGKTALIGQFAAKLRSQGTEVIIGRCWEAQGVEPFWPWPDLLRDYVDGHGRDTVESLAGDTLEDLGPLLPECWADATDALQPIQAREYRYSTFRVMRAAARFLQRAAEAAPLVLVLEDLHLADAAALELLEFLCRSLDRSRLLLVGTCRPLDAQQRVQLRSALEGALPHVWPITLRGLSNEDMALWINIARGRSIPAQFAARVRRVTEGHPLLVENLLRMLPNNAGTKDLDRMALAEAQLPERITNSIRRCLEQLSPRTLELLRAASVIGEELPVPLLSTALGYESPEIVKLVEEAWQRGIVARDAMGAFHFAHALVRATLYQELDPSTRIGMHASMGRAYLGLVGERPQEVVRAAHHLLAAVPTARASEAVEVARKAAEWARHHESYELAADFYTRALGVFAPGEGNPRLRAELLRDLAQVQCFAGRSEDALRSYEEMLEVSDVQGLEDLFAEAVLGEWHVKGESIVVDEQFQARLKAALGRARMHGRLYAPLLTANALVTVFTETEEARTAQIREALRISRSSDNAAARLSVLEAVMLNAALPVDVSYTLALAEETLELAHGIRALDRVVDAGCWRAGLLLELGRGSEFSAEVSRSAERAKRLHPSFAYRTRLLESGRAFMAGELSDAESLARSAFASAVPVVEVFAGTMLALQLQRIALEKDGAARAALLRESLAILEPIAPFVQGYFPSLVQLSRVRFELGRVDDFRAVLAMFSERRGLPLGLPAGVRIGVFADLAECAATLKDERAIRMLVERLRPALGLHASIACGASYAGPVSLSLGRLALATSSMPEAQVMFERAIREADSVGAKPHRAWAEFRLAQALEGNEDAGRRRGLLDSAWTAAERYGLARLKRMIEESAS